MITTFAAKTDQLARQLGLAAVAQLDGLAAELTSKLTADNAIFELLDQQLVLHLLLDNKPDILKFDLAEGDVAERASRVSKSNEVIAKAIGCKSHYRPRVLDATAGMGRDSLIMAMLGCKVIMQERNFAIYQLLNNALIRLKREGTFKPVISDNISLYQQDSIKRILPKTPELEEIRGEPLEKIDVIYLDPMFPERKKSALVKKEMRLFKLVAGDDLDCDQLLISSLNSPVKRVVVKRPKNAPLLAGKEPSHKILVKKFRYDVYLK